MYNYFNIRQAVKEVWNDHTTSIGKPENIGFQARLIDNRDNMLPILERIVGQEA